MSISVVPLCGRRWPIPACHSGVAPRCDEGPSAGPPTDNSRYTRTRCKTGRNSTGLARLLACLASFALAPPVAAGEPHVVDGVSIVLDGLPIRLMGIDPPERDEECAVRGRTSPCGAVAAKALAALVQDADVRCDGTDRPRFGRIIVATCWANGLDLSAELVRRGLVRADRHYSTRYINDEAKAQDARRGMWDD